MRLTATATYRPRGDLGRYVEAKIRPAIKVGVEESCRLVESSAKNFAAVDTGAMRDSIDTVIDDSQKLVIVGVISPHVFYAPYVEFGTRNMAAQPFMRPALDENLGKVMRLLEEALNSALR